MKPAAVLLRIERAILLSCGLKDATPCQAQCGRLATRFPRGWTAFFCDVCVPKEIPKVVWDDLLQAPRVREVERLLRESE